MPKSYMNFTVNGDSIVCNMLNGEVQGRLRSAKDPEMKRRYIENGVVESSPVITDFILRNPKTFGNAKLIQRRNGINFLDSVLAHSPLTGTEESRKSLATRMKIEYDLTDSETARMESFLEDFHSLTETPEIKQIVSDTEDYKKSIEGAWRNFEQPLIACVKEILGYEPEKVGNINTYILYPTFDVHRAHQVSGNRTSLFFAKRNDNDINKILAYLTHQAVHQPMLPYKNTMTQSQKEIFNSFVNFLTDKEIYSRLSEKSGLDIVAQNENGEIMGKIYPFWLGYRYRNADKDGLDPVEEIRETIKRDKEYYDSLPEGSKKKKLYSAYEFEKLDPEKIAILFRERRGITPYQFAEIDFEQKDLVIKDRYLKSKKMSTVSGTEEGR
ncbi:MAG: hypothetical protein IJW20_06575 [Clostridia bacterium]|nr:hypothetical protein [Clostridia bacterium]